MLEQVLTEEDISWLAKILAMIPGLPIPEETIQKLHQQELIAPRGEDGWEATEKGIITITTWQPN